MAIDWGLDVNTRDVPGNSINMVVDIYSKAIGRRLVVFVGIIFYDMTLLVVRCRTVMCRDV